MQYQEGRVVLGSLKFDFTYYNIISKQLPDHIPTVGEVYFYHSDHLGSASWITDHNGNPVQYLQYAPYGEITLDQHPFNYQERFKFTGKELDKETMYYYFGARNLESYYITGFTSVDPLADKYIGTQSYAYCEGNPIGLKDIKGRNPALALPVVGAGAEYFLIAGGVVTAGFLLQRNLNGNIELTEQAQSLCDNVKTNLLLFGAFVYADAYKNIDVRAGLREQRKRGRQSQAEDAQINEHHQQMLNDNLPDPSHDPFKGKNPKNFKNIDKMKLIPYIIARIAQFIQKREETITINHNIDNNQQPTENESKQSN